MSVRATTATAPSAGAPLDLGSPIHYINRELSWLDFNQRVLDQAMDESHPLLERVKFLAIVGSNLDEFFMVRVASLRRWQRAGQEHLSPDGLTVVQQLNAIRRRATQLLKNQAACWSEHLRAALAANGVQFVEPEEYDERITRYLASWFKSDAYPLLTPLAIDPGHPFPQISNRSTNFAVVVHQDRRTRFARVKVPALLPRFVPLPARAGHGALSFAFLEDVIRMNLGELFPGIDVRGAHLFRVVRDSDIDVRQEGGDDLMEQVHRSLRELRDGPPSLLHVEDSTPRRIVELLVENFEVDDDVVIRSRDRLAFCDWASLYRLPLAGLKYPSYLPRAIWPPEDRGNCVFDDIRAEDVLVHHPFDSFSAVEAFVRDAATDPHVLAIKMTLYRIGENSPLIELLIEAAEAGKQVAVLVELKARFDERNNIAWATRLEDAGVHVVYGVEQLKTHAKLCLVVRREPHGIQRYAHVGTGNYNRATAQAYTDVGLFTADPAIVDDVSDVFNALTGYSRRRAFRQMLVAPHGVRRGLVARIEREIEHARAGRPARLIFKANALTDPGIIRALYKASGVGVDVDLIIRGICCARPGTKGLSERIRVRSIIGRFLEHSRIYWFLNGGDEEMYIGSADLMERNLDRRVETLCRVRDGAILRHLRDVVLEYYLRDNQRAYVLHDGKYEKVVPAADDAPFDAQEALIAWSARQPADDEEEDDAAS
jgi:polyphosphate kinase